MIHLDFETFSEVDLKLCGMARYAEDETTEILLVGFAIDDEEPVCAEPHEVDKLEPLFEAIKNGVIVGAHNFGFEKLIWYNVGVKRFCWPEIPEKNWNCTAARCRAMGLPGALDKAAKVLNLPIKKDKKGMQLIQRYSKLVRDKRHYLKDNPEDLESFKDYCKTDVLVERQLDNLLPNFSNFEKEIFFLDDEINARGIPVNVKLLEKAQILVDELTEHFDNQSIEISGYKATQNKRVLEFLNNRGLDLPNLQAKTVEDAKDRNDLNPEIKRFLEIRYESSRVGLKKIKKILAMVSNDGTVKYCFFYHGATTGRWVSVGVQLQNFGKTSVENQKNILSDVLTLNSTSFLEKYDRPMTALSQALRGVIQAPKGMEIVAADYSAIEARILAWLSGEEWLVKAYEDGQDVYVKMSASIYKIDESEIDGDKRFFGKQVILGAGYSMSGARFTERCKDFGVHISGSEGNRIIKLYRNSVPNIVKLWNRFNKATLIAVKAKKRVNVNGIKFFVEGKFLVIQLPSGRKLHYLQPKVQGNNVSFTGFFNGAPVRNSLYGGLITQNICQAIGRDLLAYGLIQAKDHGYDTILHVHDDITTLKPIGSCKVEDFEKVLCIKPDWAEGLPLAAEGWIDEQWRK